MRLVLMWLAMAFVSIASLTHLDDLISEFPNDCAMSCTGTYFLTLLCDRNSTCWCQTPDFVPNLGCCIAHMCREDISKVKNTFNSWCITASGQGLPASVSSTNCSFYDSDPFGAGTSSSSSSGNPSTASNSVHSHPIIPILTGRVIGGVVSGCLAVIILLCVWLWYRIRLSKEARREGPSRPMPRVATPPPPYSMEAPRIIELDRRDRSKDGPTEASGQIV